MKFSRASYVLGLAALIGLVLALPARADIFMKQKTHTDEFKMMGRTQPAKDVTMTIWLTDNKARMDQDGGVSSILLADQKVLGMTTSAEAWATEAIKVDYAMAFAMANAMMASVPGFEKIVAEMKKIKGVIVSQTATAKVMGAEVKSTTEPLECQEKTAPPGTYDVPAGYAKVKGGVTG
jgi:hypothetical protein